MNCSVRFSRSVFAFIGAFFLLLFTMTEARAIIFTFSDKDFLGGASWGTMEVTAFDSDTLTVRYGASPSGVIPTKTQATGFGFAFDSTPTNVSNPGNSTFGGDRNDLDWRRLSNLNAIPNPSNGDEFVPPITKSFYSFGVTEWDANNISPPGILPGEFDVFYLSFAGIPDLTAISLEDFVNVTGVRLQSLPNAINQGSLFLAGKTGDGGNPVPEPATMLLIGSGLLGLAGFARKRIGK